MRITSVLCAVALGAAAWANPLLHRPDEFPAKPVLFDQIRPEHVAEAVRIRLGEAKEKAAAYKKQSGAATFANTVVALRQVTDSLDFTLGLIRTVESTAGTPEYRKAVSAAVPAASAFRQELTMDPEIAARVNAFAKGPEAAKLGAAEKRLLEVTLQAFRRNGALLDAKGRARVNEINQELQKLSMQFSANATAATGAFEILVGDEKELAGLPAWLVETAKADAAKRGKQGWRLSLLGSTLQTVLANADHEPLRKAMYLASQTAASSSNTEVANRQLVLRAEKAKLLGYASFADYQTEDRMAKSGANAMRFLNELDGGSRDAAKREMEELAAFRRELEGKNAPAIEAWDVFYYANKMSKKVNGASSEEYRPYFPLPKVMDGLFAFVKRLYGVEFERVVNPHVVDSTVEYYRVHEGGKTIAYMYLDLFARESKQSGAWMSPLLTAVPGRVHLGGIYSNLSLPAQGKPALLTHNEVKTLFHEMGHYLHLSLSRTPYSWIGGTNVAWDFVELPSQLMENFLYDREVLSMCSGHLQTGEKLPAGLYESLLKQRTFRTGTALLSRTGQSMMDLLLHSDYKADDAPGGLQAYSRRVMQRYQMVTVPEEANPVARFMHLFAGGYAAGYYSYLWSEMLDSDAYTRFEKNGVFDPQTAKSFRERVLEKGNSKPADQTFRDFAGRDPETKSLLRKYGLTEGK